MKILNFGSLNIDRVYSVEHFVRPGETISSGQLHSFCGGKGLNQSIALARAGAEVYHAGAVGREDGTLLIGALEKSGVDTHLIQQRAGSSGHAIIQIDPSGQNCILLYGGANQTMTEAYIEQVLSQFAAGDYVILQNEINLVGAIMRKAKARGMKVVLNPSPMDEKIKQLPLELVDIFLLNEVEASDLCGREGGFDLIGTLCKKYATASIVLTLGKLGAVYQSPDCPQPIKHGIYRVPVVDTTAAGDTFTGYFITAYAEGKSPEIALQLASLASSIAVSRKGAEPSIPYLTEVLAAACSQKVTD